MKKTNKFNTSLGELSVDYQTGKKKKSRNKKNLTPTKNLSKSPKNTRNQKQIMKKPKRTKRPKSAFLENSDKEEKTRRGKIELIDPAQVNDLHINESKKGSPKNKLDEFRKGLFGLQKRENLPLKYKAKIHLKEKKLKKQNSLDHLKESGIKEPKEASLMKISGSLSSSSKQDQPKKSSKNVKKSKTLEKKKSPNHKPMLPNLDSSESKSGILEYNRPKGPIIVVNSPKKKTQKIYKNSKEKLSTENRVKRRFGNYYNADNFDFIDSDLSKLLEVGNLAMFKTSQKSQKSEKTKEISKFSRSQPKRPRKLELIEDDYSDSSTSGPSSRFSSRRASRLTTKTPKQFLNPGSTSQVLTTSTFSRMSKNKQKNTAMQVESNMRKFRYKLRAITTEIDKLERNYRHFKTKKDGDLEELAFVMEKLLKTEQNTDLDSDLNDYLRKEIKKNDVMIAPTMFKKLKKLGKAAGTKLTYSRKDNSVVYRS